MIDDVERPLPKSGMDRRWWWEWEAAVLGILVVAIYFTRLTTAPVCGEESRWANGAREMIASGDWIVPRQQGAIFPERPPLGSWAMGLAGLARGKVDVVAIRLPSVLAMLALTWLIYAYARSWMSRLGSFSSAVVFATFGQVLQLGRFGESEAVFTLFIAASLLLWHLGYLRAWPAVATWSLGYSLAALGALTKGPQAPVYFVAATCAFLIWKRNWRYLFTRAHACGIACFCLVVGAWLLPFAISNWAAVDDIWAALAQERFSWRMWKHVATYPLETMGCLLPWSPLLLALLNPTVRQSILARRPQAQFLIVALATSYPTVWFAAGARGRYYMPLYPCLALLIGLVIEHCTDGTASEPVRLFWRRYLRGLSVVVVLSGAALTLVSFLPGEELAAARQTSRFLSLWIMASLAAAGFLVWASLADRSLRPQFAVIAVAGFVGLAYAGPMINSRVQGGNDLTLVVSQARQHIPDQEQLVSFGRIYHRFAYSYETPIRQVPWPVVADELPADVTYFCFDHRPGDTWQQRSTDDGRKSAPTPGNLPFEWDPIAIIPCDPYQRSEADRTVVIGRVNRRQTLAQQPRR